MTTEVSTPEAKSEWDEITAERETGIRAAEKPPVEAVTEPVVAQPDPLLELRQMVEKIEHRTKSTEGRIGAIDKSVHEMLQAAAKAATQQVNNAPTQAQVNQAIQDPAEWAALKREHPEWALATEKGVDARIEAHLAQLKGQSVDPAQIAKMVQEQVAGQSAVVRKEIIDASLDAVFPEWKKDVGSTDFKKWLDAQAPEVKAFAMSESVGDAAKMLKLYEQSKVVTPTANIVAARKQVLANAASAPKGIRPTPTKSEADMTDKELWALEAKKRDQKRASRF